MDNSEKKNVELNIDNGELKTSMIPEDFTDPQILYDKLISMIKKYHPSGDISQIEKAYKIAYKAHDGQLRKSGEPYIIHPVCVCIILAELELDKETIVAGMLHDVVEDTVMTSEEIAAEFGDEVALLVDGVTKLTQLNYVADKVEVQAENLRKMFLAMAKDIRVILIKLADRLHNQRTMQYQTPEKQKEKSRETLDIYAPIADRLGISKVKVELDDLAFRYLEPEVYNNLVARLDKGRVRREEFIKQIVAEVDKHIKAAGIEATIDGRAKHYFSIYKKMITQNKKLEQIYDLFAVRIIVDTERDCYTALGVIHEIYKPIPGHFKDYIAMPKPNNYQSLHTTLIGPQGQPFEIQIRTYEMHRTAEYGIAAHWKYKENQYGHNTADSEEEKLAWLRRILEWQRDMSDNQEFMDTIKTDLDAFNDSVFCFSPSGEVISLVEGSTPVDFAYAIHSAVGNTMVGARVNGRIVNFDYQIQNGDRVEIVTSQNSRGPSRDWLNFVKTSQARSKINQWYKKINKEENIVKGRELIEREAKRKGYNIADLTTPKLVAKVLERYSFRDWDSICAAVGHGGLKEGQIVNKLNELYQIEEKKKKTADQLLKEKEEAVKAQVDAAAAAANAPRKKTKSGVYIKGIGDTDVRFSKCCGPVPGDEIVGFVTRGRGVSIHRTDCVNIINLSEEERARLLEAEWSVPLDNKGEANYSAEIRVFAPNRDGLTVDILKVLVDDGVPVLNVNARALKNDSAVIDLSMKIKGKEQLEFICKKILQISGVDRIERVTT